MGHVLYWRCPFKIIDPVVEWIAIDVCGLQRRRSSKGRKNKAVNPVMFPIDLNSFISYVSTLAVMLN